MLNTTNNQSTISSTSIDSQSVIYENPENQIQRSKKTLNLYSEQNQNQKTKQIRLIDAYKDLYFYFKNKYEFENYIIDVAKALGVSGSYKESLDQLEKTASSCILSGTKVEAINCRYLRIRGTHIRIFNGLLGIPLSKLEVKIVKVTKSSGKGGIITPKFPTGEIFLNSLARLVATSLADGHLKPNGTIEYSEPDLSRIKIVEQNLRNFGNVSCNPRFVTRDNHYICYLPTPFGTILKYLGIKSGNKSITNPVIPYFVTNGSQQQICAFFEDFIPQDGTVSSKVISLTQSTSLHPGKSINDYPEAFQLDNDLIKFIIRHGKNQKSCRLLSRKKLVRLMNTKSTPDSKLARKLNQIVHQNPNNIIIQSAKMAKKIGVDMNARPYAIRYFKKSGKITVEWIARTNGLYDMIKLAIVAPPNDVIKREILRDVLRKNKDHVNKAIQELTARGILVNTWWK